MSLFLVSCNEGIGDGAPPISATESGESSSNSEHEFEQDGSSSSDEEDAYTPWVK